MGWLSCTNEFTVYSFKLHYAQYRFPTILECIGFNRCWTWGHLLVGINGWGRLWDLQIGDWDHNHVGCFAAMGIGGYVCVPNKALAEWQNLKSNPSKITKNTEKYGSSWRPSLFCFNCAKLVILRPTYFAGLPQVFVHQVLPARAHCPV